MNRLSLATLLVAGLLGTDRLNADEREAFFEARIRPVLVGLCFRCHGGTKASGSLHIDSREQLLEGGESGPAIVPGRPDESLLIRAIQERALQRRDGVVAMPPDGEKPLRPGQVADFVAWVKAGAYWPTHTKLEAARHWAFEPIQDPPVPNVRDKAWVQNSIDAFIRGRQETVGANPAPPADKLALIRRATFDLTGLPPTPEEVDAFLQDESPRAFEVVVDRLLEKPAYGERWGRHWLDVVRYADTAGETADYPAPLAWRYRNYVIDALNADKPYDEFLREQIAGDVLASAGPPQRYAESVTATGYLAISRRFGFDSENYHHLTIQDTIDTLGQTVLGLSLGCARCHDHKFDPISMRDYYALYGIFDSSRYAFPGSEQKQKTRSVVPLSPPAESQARWREHEARVASLSRALARRKKPAPPNVVLRSLDDMDGDFELQAPAAGGSKGVLVSPWSYQGVIGVTEAAQSPLKNVYPAGKVGASVAAEAGEYRIAQAIHPRRTRDNCGVLHVNLDFRVSDAADSAPSDPGDATSGWHRFSLRTIGGDAAVEILVSSRSLAMRSGETIDRLGTLKPNEWHNLQLTLDLASRVVAGRFGSPGATMAFPDRPFSPGWTGAIDSVVFDTFGSAAKLPAIQLDNLGVQESPMPPASTEPPMVVGDQEPNEGALSEQLRALTGIDGDLELQTGDAPPSTPWNAGPNSVVRLASSAQSPYENIHPPGRLGLRMPNRGEYDGFGLALPAVKPDASGRLFVAFDFRCATRQAGGDGSWRYYLGHGAGSSAAIELFFNANEFFRRSGDARESVCRLTLGQWYQVQLTLDMKARTYAGLLAWPDGQAEFNGQVAAGWDGGIDYTFIDSYGHLGGVRPSLDADNFVIGAQALPPLNTPAAPLAAAERATRRAEVAKIREQLAAIAQQDSMLRSELESLLARGPLAVAYGVAEGTPRDARIQTRGEPDQPGDLVPRGFIQALGGGPLPANVVGSGRRELAQWLTRSDNPLTARVMVNRIWQYHFGRGLVKTPNDFGARGLPPTHPDLLDHLATRFVRGGWSIKAMHRLVMLSATYQQASPSYRGNGSDEDRRIVGHGSGTDATELYCEFPRRRLSAEEIRDAILAVTGQLDSTPGHEHPFPTPISWGYTQHAPFSAVYDHDKRSVYLMTQRLKRHPFLALFDGADPNATTADRLATTVPTQALFFLNDPFVHEKAARWADRLRAGQPQRPDSPDSSDPSIAHAYREALGRAPTPAELSEAVDFLTAYRKELVEAKLDEPDLRALAALLRTLLGSNEFLHVE